MNNESEVNHKQNRGYFDEKVVENGLDVAWNVAEQMVINAKTVPASDEKVVETAIEATHHAAEPMVAILEVAGEAGAEVGEILGHGLSMIGELVVHCCSGLP